MEGSEEERKRRRQGRKKGIGRERSINEERDKGQKAFFSHVPFGLLYCPGEGRGGGQVE
jgi:hypothetical protein